MFHFTYMSLSNFCQRQNKEKSRCQATTLMPLNFFVGFLVDHPIHSKKVTLGLLHSDSIFHPNSIRFVRYYDLMLSDCWESDSLGKGCTRTADKHLHQARNLSNLEAKECDELRLEYILLNLLPSQPLLRDLHSRVTFQVSLRVVPN